MPHTAFDDFCRDLFDTLGVAPPPARPPRAASEPSPPAVSVDYRDVALVMAPSGTADAPLLSLLVDFGEVPQQEQSEVYPALLQANFMMLQAGAPSFSLHPVTGRVTYQITLGLAQADPRAIAGALEGIADAVLQWRETRGLPGLALAPCGPGVSPHDLRA